MARGAVLPFAAMWRFSQRWYAGRDKAEWRRFTPQQMVQLFRESGLDGDFWSLPV